MSSEVMNIFEVILIPFLESMFKLHLWQIIGYIILYLTNLPLKSEMSILTFISDLPHIVANIFLHYADIEHQLVIREVQIRTAV